LTHQEEFALLSSVSDPVRPVAPGPAGAGVLLRLEGITKRFPGVLALDGVSFEVRGGEVHAVCGENGAGKSTLMKVISGQYQPDAGALYYRGEVCQFRSTSESEAAGIAIIHQELNLAPHLTVAENIYLAREPRKGWLIDRAALRRQAQQCLDRLGLDIAPGALVKTLSVAQQQMVEIAKALSLNAEVLIMDEPTSSLTESETERLFAIIHELGGGYCLHFAPPRRTGAYRGPGHCLARRTLRVHRTPGRHQCGRDRGQDGGALAGRCIPQENIRAYYRRVVARAGPDTPGCVSRREL
jgi:ABC-type branched-subunit amino acid transport system ATPase component